MMRTWLWIVVGAACCGAARSEGLDVGPGVVRGAQTLHIRQGAGTEYPSIGYLREGDRVDVRSVSGSWAVVRTSTGGTGYVRIEYLANTRAAAERTAAAAPAAPKVEPDEATSGPQQAALLEELSVLRNQNAKLEAELRGLREQLAAGAPPPDRSAGDLEGLRADVGRVLALAQTINDRMAARQGQAGSADPVIDRPSVDANVWLLAGACVVFGLLLGGGYGRLTERSRRSRIRL